MIQPGQSPFKFPREPRSVHKIDWRAYWKEFQRAHGDYPVKYRGVLLFRDGWTYSASHYEGPEWPPPEDAHELKKLVRAYWLHHKREIRSLWWPKEQELRNLEQLQSVKSLSLQVVGVETTEDGYRRRTASPLDLEPLRFEVAHLKDILAECDVQIKLLETPTPTLEYSVGASDGE